MAIEPILLDSTGRRMADSLEKLVDKLGTHTITIIATATDGVDVVDQEIHIYNLNTGVLYGTVVYNSPDTISIEVPNGFSYEIVPNCTLPNHYCTDKPSGIATGDVTVTLTYKSLGDLETIVDLKAVLDAGLMKYVELGTEVKLHHDTYGDLGFEVVNYDSDNEVVTLLQSKVLRIMQFDAPEALYRSVEGLVEGNYSFVHSNKTYYFALTKPLPSNGQIVATATSFSTYSSGYSSDYIERGTVSETVLENATSLGTTATGMLNHMDRVNYGSNDYGESGLSQWLNATGRDWWVQKTMFDRVPSYVNDVGFLSGISKEQLDVIDDTEVLCASQNVYCAPDSNHGKNEKYTVTQKFFLASEMEMFGSSIFIDGSKLFGLYVGATNADRIKYAGTSASHWWLRTPHSSAHNERYVLSSGAVSSISAVNAIGVVAACQISKSK